VANTSGNVAYNDVDMIFTANCIDETTVPLEGRLGYFLPSNPLIGGNNNLTSTSGTTPGTGGTVSIKQVIVQGYINSAGAVPRAVAFSGPGWTLTKGAGANDGLIEIPHAKNGASTAVPSDPLLAGAAEQVQVIFTDATTIDGIRVRSPILTDADTTTTFAQIRSSARTVGSTVQNTLSGTTTPSIYAPGAPMANNISNRARDGWTPKLPVLASAMAVRMSVGCFP
jgi:hypothetical protein